MSTVIKRDSDAHKKNQNFIKFESSPILQQFLRMVLNFKEEKKTLD